MKILNLNTWTEKGPWRERWKIILEAVDELQPDVICFQEIFSPNWAEEIQKQTGYPTLVYLPESKVSGLAVLSKFTLLASSSFKFQAQSFNFEPRRFLLCAQFKAGESDFFIFNTHLTWRVNESEVRQKQVDEILSFIKQESPSSKAVLCGDFNASPDTPEIRKFLSAGFTDTYETLNSGSKTLTWDNQNPFAASASTKLPDRRIDFIFTKGFTEPKSSEVVLDKPNEKGIFASDHYGVLTEWR